MSGGWTFSPEVIDKARRYLDEGRVSLDESVPGVWWVSGSDRTRRYRVQTDADSSTMRATWINCTCPHGLNVGAGTARCSHAVAVLLLVQAEGRGQLWPDTRPRIVKSVLDTTAAQAP